MSRPEVPGRGVEGQEGVPVASTAANAGGGPLADPSSSQAWLAARLDRLQRISAELGRTRDVGDVARAAVALLSEASEVRTCGLWLVGPDGDVLELVAQHGIPEAAAAPYERVPVDAPVPVAVAFRSATTLRNASRSESEDAYAGLQGAERVTEGFVAVPLIMEQRVLGAFAMGVDDQPSAADVLFLEAFGAQVAQTLVRLRLAERAERRVAELEFLADLTSAALAASDHRELMRNVTAAAVPMLGDWCSIHFVPEDGGPTEVEVGHVDPGRARWARRLFDRHPTDPEAESGVAAVIRTGVTRFVPHVDDEFVDDEIARSHVDEAVARTVVDQLDLTSVITVPLRTKRRIVGAMEFTSAESGRRYGSDDVALAEAVAGRLAEPLDVAWQAAQQRRIALTLQRALLPPRLPTIDGLDVAARYLPAGTNEVGGDFFDVFACGTDEWALLIGDACGTGPDAAALSSIARHTVRAAARHGFGHAAVMTWLNEAIARSDRDLFCTACYATLLRCEGRWVLRTVASGHPLPILVRHGRVATIGRPGTLLGVFDEIDLAVVDTPLLPGDVVVLHTDGVTDLPPPFGLSPAAMMELIAGLAPTSALAVADGIERSIVERVPDRQRRDDVALLVVRVAEDDGTDAAAPTAADRT